jgi:hypothetical protein
MSENACPKCRGSALVTGKAVRNFRGSNYADHFEPDGLRSRWFRLLRTVETPLLGGFQACLECGVVWSHVSPEALRAIIENQRTDEAKSHLPK